MARTRAHDQTVVKDYFAAMERVEQRLEIVPEPKQEIKDEGVKVQPGMFQLIQQLEIPELCLEERLGIVMELRAVLSVPGDHTPP